VWARDESNPAAPVGLKVIEEVFVRTAQIIHLHVGGQVIKTTSEHPFYVYNKGWTRAGDLKPGDRLSSHDGQWVAVEEVFDTGEYATVYNLRVADWHTYFVGDEAWGFSLWAHNACTQETVEEAIKSAGLDPEKVNIAQITRWANAGKGEKIIRILQGRYPHLDAAEVADLATKIVTSSPRIAYEKTGATGVAGTFEDAEAAQKAALEEIAKWTNKEVRDVSTVVGGVNKRTGATAVGVKVTGKNEGMCAEDIVVKALGGNREDVLMTKAVRPYNNKIINVCPRCQTKYSRNQFPADAKYD
jgi:hypothetical protein